MTKNLTDLTNIQMDILKELGNIGAGNAVTSLSKLLNRRIEMNVPRVKVLEFKQVSEIFGGAETLIAGILLNVVGDINGSIMFALKIDAAKILVGILMGKHKSEYQNIDIYEELNLSALKELGNILTSSYLLALSNLTNLKIHPSVPDLAIDMAGAIISVPAIEFGKHADTVLYIETEFLEGSTRVAGDFILVPELQSYDILLKALGVEV